jgi:hypothetical protein
MHTFRSCASCACYVRRHESRCPFCDAPLPSAPPQPAPLRGRMSRAQWFALGSTLVTAGCSSSSAPLAAADVLVQRQADAAAAAEAAVDAAAEAVVDAEGLEANTVVDAGAPLPPADAAVNAQAETVACGAGACDLSTQYCLCDWGVDAATESNGCTCQPVPVACDGRVACSCAPPSDPDYCVPGTQQCAELSPGVLAISPCQLVVPPPGPCYGSPPPRFGRARALS